MDLSTCCCCEQGSWANHVYLQLKGEQSFRHLAEIRVNWMLDYMTPEAIDLACYDNGGLTVTGKLSTPNGLVQGLKQAVANYRAIYPMSRWRAVPAGSDAGDCGPYDTWEDPHGQVGTAETTAAIENATGLKVQAANDQWWINIEPQVAQLLLNVPTGGGEDAVRLMPTAEQVYKPDGNSLAISDWTKAFLGIFCPDWQTRKASISSSINSSVRVMATAAATKALPAVRKSLVTLMSTSRAQLSQQIETDQSSQTRPGVSKSTTSVLIPVVAVVGVAAALGAVAYLHYR